MHHGLVCPLHEQGCDRVFFTVQQKQYRAGICSPAAKVKQLPLFPMGQLIQSLSQPVADI